MKLGIDGYFLCGTRTGMGVMLENILASWPCGAFEKTVLFVPEELDERRTMIFQKNGMSMNLS